MPALGGLAAERLFATNGIGGVSLREISAAAGQRNTSAAHYYFGDKDTLVRAVFEYRMAPINAHRGHMLEELRSSGEDRDPRRLLEALVLPMAAGIVADGYYGRFLAHLHTDPGYRLTYDWEEASALREVWDAITETLGDLPPRVLRNRMRMLRSLVNVTAGEMEQRGATASGDDPQEWALDLVEACLGLVTAPVRENPGGQG